MKMKILYFKEHILHDLLYHPENSSRIESIKEDLKKEFDFEEITPEFNEDIIKKIHSEKYIRKIHNLCERVEKYHFLDADTYIVRGTYKAAVLSANLLIRAYEMNKKHVFALTRPPGHHAKKDSQGGFCIFNNVAILISRILEDGKKILVLDLDYHHGNGTQELLSSDVTYISIHRFGVYPGTGLYYEKDGKDIYNIPLEYESINDVEYFYVFRKIVLPIIYEKSPDIIVVSMGFDGYKFDPIGDWSLERVWRNIFKELRDFRIIFALEGGYNPIGIYEGLKEIKEGLNGKEAQFRGNIRQDYQKYIDDLAKYFGIKSL